MANSTITLQNVIDYARTFPELAPVLPISGLSTQPALTIGSQVMSSMLSPGMPWKWNRFILPVFYTNSLQQDYAVPGVVLLGWAEDCFAVDINSTQTPLPKWPVEIVREISSTSWQYGPKAQICSLPNNQLAYGTWAANTTYTKILGTSANPGTALTQIQDPNGNLWVLTNNVNATVVTGTVQPTWPNPPTFPTYGSPLTAASVVNDSAGGGTAQWTAVNPSGQGFRLNPLPSNTGLYFEVHVIGQKRPPTFTALSQLLEPISDDERVHFDRGFIAFAKRHSRDKEVRAEFDEDYKLWIASMGEFLSKSAREREGFGIYPTESITQPTYIPWLGPANPFFPGGW